tara:strand:- start:3077 stop:3301 length:225 start_codon:yes stop_codon:yes gene_type:complete
MTHTYSGTELKVGEDLTDETMKLRQDALAILLKKFGNGDYGTQSIYKCADEWCRKQHTTSGIVDYYKAYFASAK